jgi:phosphate transport system substrate-binding protein
VEVAFVKRLLMTAFGIVLAMVVTGHNLQAENSKRQVIRAKGSDSMAGRIDMLSKIFLKDHPDCLVIVSGGARSTGLDALAAHTCEVAMAPRKMTESEKKEAKEQGIELVERLVGYGGIAVLVNDSLPISELSTEQVQKILKGEYTSWKQAGGPDEPIELIVPGQVHAGTLFFLEREFLSGSRITDKASNAGSFQSVIRKVGESKGGIGVTRIRDALESSPGEEARFKLLAIKKDPGSPAVKPSRKSVADGTYPIRRPFFIYYDSAAGPDIREFVDFISAKRKFAALFS